MEFGIEKCALPTRKRETTEARELSNHENLGKLGEKENYKNLGILKAETIKQTEIKEKVRKKCLKRKRKLLKTKLCSRNLIRRISTWVFPFVRHP